MDTIGTPALWAGFIAFVLAMLALDLGVFHRKAHSISYREAAIWSAIWVSLSLVFAAGVWWRFGATAGTEFLTGYLIEKSLSVDNIFVFVIVFGAMSIPPVHQHRVLFWGILSALVLRAAMIFAGTAALQRFHWLIYVFGAFLIFTAVRLALEFRKGDDGPKENSRLMKLAYRLIPSTPHLDGKHFFTRGPTGRWLATPLLMTLMLVEVTDVLFALDSIPAIFAVTKDPFIVFTSNIFAILGLRSLFFLLAGMVEQFHYLKAGLAAVLLFVGVKMMLTYVLHIPAVVSLAIIAALLGAAILASWLRTRRLPHTATHADKPPAPPGEPAARHP